MKYSHHHRLYRSKKYTNASHQIKKTSHFNRGLSDRNGSLSPNIINVLTANEIIKSRQNRKIVNCWRHICSQDVKLSTFHHHERLFRPEKHTHAKFKIKPIILARFNHILGKFWAILNTIGDYWRHKSSQDVKFSTIRNHKLLSRPKKVIIRNLR